MSQVSPSTLKENFCQQLETSFPELKNADLQSIVSENLLSPFNIELPQAVLDQAQEFIKTIFAVRETPAYLHRYDETIKLKGLSDPENKSIVMSYDFHLDEQQNLKLIEINTNAGFMALGHEMYKSKSISLPIADFTLAEITENIRSEMYLNSKGKKTPKKIAIIDDKPSEQRLYAEFLLYNELFKSQGWDSRILDYKEVFNNYSPDFVYNRHTDFFLTGPESLALREKFLNKEICLSPNPFEYLLLADKQRLIDWSQSDFFTSLGVSTADANLLTRSLPQSLDACPENADLIWSKRKTLFLKPKNAFGSKQSYKGASISRKAFEDLIQEDTIAQEYIPAPEVSFETNTGPQKFKYDLRCYAYQGRLQLVLARLYQGQVTNLRTPLGGFACVIFK